MPHRGRIWTVRSYSPGGANVHPSNYMFPMAHPSPHPKRQLDRLSRFCTTHGRVSVYFTMGRPFPFKITPSHGDLVTHLVHGSLGPPEPKRHLVRFSRFAGLTIVTDRPTGRQTDHATPSVTRMWANTQRDGRPAEHR